MSTKLMLFAVPAVLLIMFALLCWDCTFDDSYIAFRYAGNLAGGDGLVFNVGDRVEGFSNPSWVLLMSAAHLLGLDMVATSKVIGLACGVVMLFVMGWICRGTLGLSRGLTFAVLCYLATNISVVYYVTSGMETPFYMAGIVLMIGLLAGKRENLAGCVCGLLVLTRPEGILFVLPLALGSFLNGRRPRQILGVLLIPVAAYVMFAAFRFFYYGGLLPNTYAAKIGTMDLSLASLIERTRTFFRYTLRRSTVGTAVLTLSLVSALALAGRRTLPLLASIGCAAFFVWYSKGDWANFWRFYVPVLPFIVALGFASLGLIGEAVGNERRRKVVLVMCVILIAMSVGKTAKSIRGLSSGEQFNPAMHSRPHVAIGKYLARNSSASDVVVVNEIGAIGYYSNLRILDMLGLADANVVDLMHQSNLDAYAGYILDAEPTFIMLNDKQSPGDTTMHPLHAAIYEKMQETELYEEGPVFELNSYKNLLMFIRKIEGDPAAGQP